MNESQPLNIDPLAQREQGLKERIGKKEALIEKIQSQGGLTPATVAERIRHQRELLVASYIKGTLELELQPRLTEITTQLDSAAKKLAESYEEEKAQAALEFAKLERTAKNTSRRTQIPYEDLVAEARQEITQLEERPLTDSLLQRGINLLKKEPEVSQSAPEEASREEVKKAEEPEEEEKQRRDEDKAEDTRKVTYDRKTYTVTLPDGIEVKINGSIRTAMVNALIQAFKEERLLSTNELAAFIYGSDDENSIKKMQVLFTNVRAIFEENNWRVNQLTTLSELRQGIPALYLLEKIQASKDNEEDILEPTPETFTRDEAIILARLILNFDGTNIVYKDETILTAKIDPSILEIARIVRGLPGDENYVGLNDREKLGIRSQALDKLGRILSDNGLLNETFNSQTERIQILLLWLFTENQDRYGGLLTQILRSQGDIVSNINTKNLQVRGVQRNIQISQENAALLRGLQQKAKITTATDSDIETKVREEETTEDIEEIDDTADPITQSNKPSDPAIQPTETTSLDQSEDESEQKLGIKDFTTENSRVIVEINRLEALLQQARMPDSATGYALRNLGISPTFLQKAKEEGYISSVSSLNRVDMVLLLMKKYHDLRNLTPQSVTWLKRTINETLAKRGQ